MTQRGRRPPQRFPRTSGGQGHGPGVIPGDTGRTDRLGGLATGRQGQHTRVVTRGYPEPPKGPWIHHTNPSPHAIDRTRGQDKHFAREIAPEDVVGKPVDIVYGVKPVKPTVTYEQTESAGRYLYVQWTVVVGEIEDITNFTISGHPWKELGLILGTTINFYLGTSTQAIDPIISAVDPEFDSAYPGIAHITARLDGSHPLAGKIDHHAAECTVKGLKVRVPANNPRPGSAPTLSSYSGGVLTGQFEYAFTIIDGSGYESGGSPPLSAAPVAQNVNLASITHGAGTTAGVYRRDRTLPGTAFFRIGTVNDGVSTFTDNVVSPTTQEMPLVSTKRAYSESPPECHADFRTAKRYGFGNPDVSIDWDSVTSSSTTCGTTIATPASGPGGAPGVSFGAFGTGGLLSAKQYSYVVTRVVDGVETGGSPASTATNPTNNLSAATITLPALIANQTSWRIYRNKGTSDAQTPRYLAGEVFDTTATTFVDTRRDHQLASTEAPPSNPTVPRYTIGMWIGNRASMPDWDESFRAVYSGFLAYDSRWHFYVDAPISPSALVFDTSNIIGDIQLDTDGLARRYSRVAVTFDDKFNGWQRRTAAVEHPSYSLPPTEIDREERREATLNLDGCPNWDQAQRTAIQVFNRSRIARRIGFRTFARGIRIMPGIVVTVTHPTGPLTSALVRVTDVALVNDGFAYQVGGEFYDADVYSDTPQYNPGPVQPPTPSPFAEPAPPSSVSSTEVVNIGSDGIPRAKVQVLWTPDPSPFYLGTRIEHSIDGGVTWRQHGLHLGGPFTLEDPVLNVLHTFRLYTVLVTLATSQAAQTTITPVLTNAAIPEVTQGFLFPAGTLTFTGPIGSGTLRRAAAPGVAPTLGLLAGGVVPVGSYGVRFSWVSRSGESYLSPESTILVTSGNQRLDITITEGPAGTLYNRFYIRYIASLNLPFRQAESDPASTHITFNAIPSEIAELAPPTEYDFVDHYAIYDNFGAPADPPLITTVLPSSPPQKYHMVDLSRFSHLDPSTGVPRIDVIVAVVRKPDGLQSTGKSYTQLAAPAPADTMASALRLTLGS